MMTNVNGSPSHTHYTLLMSVTHSHLDVHRYPAVDDDFTSNKMDILNDLLATMASFTDDTESKSQAIDNKASAIIAQLPPRVLSIQSTVVFGVCGNKSAMFPLQLHGFDVSPINTVQFSNHTGYPSWKGSVSTGAQMDELVDGLEANALFSFPLLITGYMGGIDCLSHLKALIGTLTQNQSDNANLFYACDPVFGDNGKLYAPSFEPFIAVYRDEIIGFADLLTPNQTEASFLLNGMEIATLSDAHAACVKFHALGIRYVVITSIEQSVDVDADGSESKTETESDSIWVVFSDREHPKKYGYVEVEKIKGYWVGTGDLTTALLFAWIQRDADDLAMAVQNTLRFIHCL